MIQTQPIRCSLPGFLSGRSEAERQGPSGPFRVLVAETRAWGRGEVQKEREGVSGGNQGHPTPPWDLLLHSLPLSVQRDPRHP